MTTADDHFVVLDLFKSASVLASTTLDLSKKNITALPESDFPLCPNLECLYLEGNRLTTVPSSLFLQCPSLKWLDLRNNSIRSLSNSVDNLKHLRTLLLEGNRLVELPSQLGNLKRLNGLSLSGNPLQYPPKDIVQQGTKAVLQYLRDKHKYLEQSEESSDEDKIHLLELLSIKKTSKPEHNLTPNEIYTKKAILQTRKKNHIQKSNNSSALNQKQQDAKKIKKAGTSIKDQMQIDKELARELSKQSLKEWRKETERLQKEAQTKNNAVIHPSASETAPFAIEINKSSSQSIASNESTSKQNSETILTEWTKDYARKLQETREKGGLLSHPPSSNLLEAEHKLAEALAMRKHFETKRARNYRLRAFTGDVTRTHET